MYPNKCILHKLTMPREAEEKWTLDEVARYEDEDYQTGRWLLRLGTNGRYIFAPTNCGKVFIWNIKSHELVGVLIDHEADVREVYFHPTERLLFTCGDGTIFIA